jgi:DNA-binding response OmpR family regulator
MNHGHYDLLITNNEMPCLTGIKLFERIRNADMTLPAMMASATFSEENARNYPRLHIDAVVSKPFGKLELLSVVRTTLSREANITMPASLYSILQIN